MKRKVIKFGYTWLYGQPTTEIRIQFESEEFNEETFVAIGDCPKIQVCILRKGDRYGIYTLDQFDMYGGVIGSGTWCNPTLNPFPYDEVKYCSFFDNNYGYFAFRIGKKWGIIKVHFGGYIEEGVYDVEYGHTKRKIVVPCEYVALADAELQLRERINWQNPVAHDI